MTNTYTHIDFEKHPLALERPERMVRFAEGYVPFKEKQVLYALMFSDLDETTREKITRMQASLADGQRKRELAMRIQDIHPTTAAKNMVQAVRAYSKHQVPLELRVPGKHLVALRTALINAYGSQSAVLVPGYTMGMNQTLDDHLVTTVEPLAKQDQALFRAMLRTNGLQGHVMFWNA